MSQPNCGCHVKNDNDDNYFIHFCELHKAARELLEACKVALLELSGIDRINLTYAEIKIIRYLEQAITHAERVE